MAFFHGNSSVGLLEAQGRTGCVGILNSPPASPASLARGHAFTAVSRLTCRPQVSDVKLVNIVTERIERTVEGIQDEVNANASGPEFWALA